MAKYYYSPIKQKILLLLISGLVLGFSLSSKTHTKVWRSLPKVLKDINHTTLRRIIQEFQYRRLVVFKDNKDGTVTVVLSELGRHHAFRYKLENLTIRIPPRWDRKWRIVVFDIPEKKKNARESLRRELKKLGFRELQKSTWIFPYACDDIINMLVELFEIRNHVRLLEVSRMSHDADLRLHFKLS